VLRGGQVTRIVERHSCVQAGRQAQSCNHEA
jgi:hypothetical protein